MTPGDFPDIATLLCDACRDIGARGWCMATSGNFSARVAGTSCMITRSGRDKSRLGIDDLMICNFDGESVDAGSKPSAETPLHTALYSLDEDIGAVLHTHSVNATLLSLRHESSLQIAGFEMQKAFAGVTSHEKKVSIPVFGNDQDMNRLARRIIDAWHEGRFEAPGFVIAGHGLYAWGRDIGEARRHVEGFEFLFTCLWQMAKAGEQ